ncbi:hypothetical protein [Brevibacillus reuszeri]|uniref:hypothetical protein n=1 Tax=Brevibacillus reuszeri TaxID=54915 RepID=UPI003D1975F8
MWGLKLREVKTWDIQGSILYLIKWYNMDIFFRKVVSILKYFLFLLLFLVIGCSQAPQVSTKTDFDNYMAELTKHNKKMNESLQSIYSNGNFKQFSQEHFLALVEEYIQNISSMKPQTTEVQELQQLHLEALKLQYEFQAYFSEWAEQTPDDARDAAMYQKLEESKQKTLEWSQKIKALSEKWQVDIMQATPENNGGLFQIVDPPN